MTGFIRVLVVDDSAFVRKVVTQMLSRSPFIDVVGAARDGAEALEMVERLRARRLDARPRDAGMDGLEFLRRQMAIRPFPSSSAASATSRAQLRWRRSSLARWSSFRSRRRSPPIAFRDC